MSELIDYSQYSWYQTHPEWKSIVESRDVDAILELVQHVNLDEWIYESLIEYGNDTNDFDFVSNLILNYQDIVNEMFGDITIGRVTTLLSLPFFDRLVSSGEIEDKYWNIYYQILESPELIDTYLSFQNSHDPQSRRLPIKFEYDLLQNTYLKYQDSIGTPNSHSDTPDGLYLSFDPIPLILSHADPRFDDPSEIERFLDEHREYDPYYDPLEHSEVP